MCAATYRERADAGMATLQMFYNPATGLWNTTGWWNSANVLETTIDYCIFTDSLTYRTNIFNTFEKNKRNNFLNEFYDDQGWWALAWIKAFDLTGESRYLNAARIIFTDMTKGWDNTCGGGIWWNKEHKYKNAISNELFLSIAARLFLRTRDQRYLDWAQRTWTWFSKTGMINASNLINDGLNNQCKNNGQPTWTYNQGVILGGLIDLHQCTNNRALLKTAEAIADAALKNLAPKGVLKEPCEPNCGLDGPQFKGIFMRNLSDLYRTINKLSYRDFILRNADSIWNVSRNPKNQFGLCWAQKFDQADAARQSAAMDTLNAAIVASRTPIILQAETGTLHNLVLEAVYTGYEAAGYVANWNRDGQWVDFEFTLPTTGRFDLIFRYAAAAGNATRFIFVNGRAIVNAQIFPGTGDWTVWNTVTIPNVSLKAGNNTVSIIFNQSKGSRNWLNLDQLIIR
ncbi:MAG: carbohydrate-binding protein [Leptolyngbya sp. Prado105]|nr:carbohydrate-binding protein [Leptolyngbya sp. Prado105]